MLPLLAMFLVLLPWLWMLLLTLWLTILVLFPRLFWQLAGSMSFDILLNFADSPRRILVSPTLSLLGEICFFSNTVAYQAIQGYAFTLKRGKPIPILIGHWFVRLNFRVLSRRLVPDGSGLSLPCTVLTFPLHLLTFFMQGCFLTLSVDTWLRTNAIVVTVMIF